MFSPLGKERVTHQHLPYRTVTTPSIPLHHSTCDLQIPHSPRFHTPILYSSCRPTHFLLPSAQLHQLVLPHPPSDPLAPLALLISLLPAPSLISANLDYQPIHTSPDTPPLNHVVRYLPTPGDWAAGLQVPRHWAAFKPSRIGSLVRRCHLVQVPSAVPPRVRFLPLSTPKGTPGPTGMLRGWADCRTL
jgi:hypothetical protein